MYDKIIKILLIVLFFSIALINSHLFDLIWIKWWFYVDWNYEFSKVMFFNILSSIIISIFFIKNFRKKEIKIPKITFLLFFLIFISNLLSDQIWTSLLWNTSKWHSSIMFINLIWLFIVLINISHEFLKKLLKTTIIWSIFVWIIWLKEYYFPTFDYWNLSNRAISTFWHPNYLALYILLLIPFLFHFNISSPNKDKIKELPKIIIFILLSFLLILTKSAWWIILFLWFVFYKISHVNIFKNKYFYLVLIPVIFSLFFYYPEKLQSFLSRFYIWETVIKIIFSDLKTFLFWWWIATLESIFDAYKVKELYIFENIWFTADRPHNIFLNFWYHLGVFWLVFLTFIVFKIFKNYKDIPYCNYLILFFLFCIFNFPWITHYLIIILIWSIIFKPLPTSPSQGRSKILIIILFISIFWAYFSSINYYNEVKIKNNSDFVSKNYFIQEINKEQFEKNLFKNSDWDFYKLCSNLTNKIPSVENYFYCWNLFWDFNDKELSIMYYNKWLNKLPDMWNKDSKYYNNFLIKELFIPERFYAEKFSNLQEILKRVWQK